MGNKLGEDNSVRYVALCTKQHCARRTQWLCYCLIITKGLLKLLVTWLLVKCVICYQSYMYVISLKWKRFFSNIRPNVSFQNLNIGEIKCFIKTTTTCNQRAFTVINPCKIHWCCTWCITVNMRNRRYKNQWVARDGSFKSLLEFLRKKCQCVWLARLDPPRIFL